MSSGGAGVVAMRSLGATLTSAAATFALFAAANWGFDRLVSESESFIQLFIFQAMFSVGMPQYGLFSSIYNAVWVWRVKRTLAADALNSDNKKADPPHLISWWSKLQHCLDDHNSIAIMAVCPIFLEIQSSELLQNLLLDHDQQQPDLYSLKELKAKWCPLELWPASTYNDIQADHTIQADQDIQADAADIHAHQDINIVQAAAADHDDAVGKYIRAGSVTLTVALLMSGLAPEYKELRYLRMRNRFQTMVTALQVGGYMLGVIQRMAQHLHITPMEAILFCLCILIALQLLIELYACGNYQRPLLLRLTPHQVSCLNHTFQNYPIKEHIFLPDARANVISLVIFDLAMVLISLFLIYHIYHYLHVSRVSALAALFFFISMITTSILHTKGALSGEGKLCKWDYIEITGIEVPLSTICSFVICVCGMVVALVGTMKDWHTFEKPTLNWFAWILPHAAS